MDIKTLLKALDDEDNSHLLNLTNEKIKTMKREILAELDLDASKMNDYLNKLDNYRYIDGMNELKYGSFLRWIPIHDPDNIVLKPGGILCDLKVHDSGVVVICKNFRNRHYQFKMDECLIFQKLNDQEHVLLSALDHLAK
jgi:hypothetical protein